MAVLEKVRNKEKIRSFLKKLFKFNRSESKINNRQNPARALACGNKENGRIREPSLPRWGVVESKKRSPRK
jgi:hypothetical protein